MSVRRSIFPFVFVALAGACGKSADDELDCTLIGCDDGVHVVVRPADQGWAAGNYTVEISTGKDSHKCTAALPNPSPWTFESTTFQCDRSSLRVFLRRADGCDDEHDGGAAGITCGSLELEIPGTPSSLHVRIDRSGETVLDESWRPKYRELQPNGPDCGPICRRSSTEATLSE
jgi:hypothetical protein